MDMAPSTVIMRSSSATKLEQMTTASSTMHELAFSVHRSMSFSKSIQVERADEDFRECLDPIDDAGRENLHRRKVTRVRTAEGPEGFHGPRSGKI